ncbi:hypothetical protein V1260_08315 [Brachybacterium sp. J144]|uniref:hypothetical protein n=1 Tax=Brachybacterium sp. J144 TaxID=3116487 RepID=UPI002E7869C8|nr:hypothetical protein [Brachybacterium sp. J144]MEE1650797.1 hypothetical protein [Brachybacterium sp. J144]
MNQPRGDQLILTLRGDGESTRALLADFFTARGWTLAREDGTRIDYERGSRGRTILLGALAGGAFHLTAQLEVREGDHATDVVYRWGPGAGLVLGGTMGRQRAMRVHGETAQALRERTARDGLLERSRTS